MKISVLMPCLFMDDWQPKLAKFAIETARAKTQQSFELVIVETESKMLDDVPDSIYLHRPKITKLTSDLNAAIDKASGDYLVHMGIDLIVGDRWLESMCECFDKFKDCGAATIRVAESGAYVGPIDASDSFDEAMYGPLMMWRRRNPSMLTEDWPEEWKFDEVFRDHSADSDLIMRMYKAGLRSYRNNKAMAWHLNKVTWHKQENTKQREHVAHQLFREKHGDCPLMMARMIMRGGVIYGREYEKG